MNVRIITLVVVLVVLAILPTFASWLQFVLTMAIAAGFAALGVGLLLRAGLISLGHAMFFAVGAYTVATFQTHLGVNGLFVLLAASIVISGLTGTVIGAFMVRYRGIFFAMLNLAASMVLFALLSKLYSITGGSDGMRVGTPSILGNSLHSSTITDVLFYGSLVVMAAIGYVVYLYMRSPLGKSLSAIGTNEIRLEYLGVSVYLTLLASYTLTAALAGLGGGIAALSLGHVFPELSYWTQSGDLLLMAVLGGITSVAGPFIGAIFIALIHTFATTYMPGVWSLIIGVALLIIIFFLPEGLFGLSGRFFGREPKQ